MDPTRYAQLVASLEQLASANPAALRRRARALVVLGYAYVLASLLLVIGTGVVLTAAPILAKGGYAAIKFGFALLVLGWLILKSLYVRAEPPEGIPLLAGHTPELERRLEEIRAALDAPKLDVILLTSAFNASVTQIPRLGIFGAQRTYLTLGIPLMSAVGREQLDAILAHEFGHLSGSHPKMGLWLFRVSRTWDQLLTQLHRKQSAGSRLFERFFRWYVPRLRAHGFVMARRDEYEADGDAARIAGCEAIGSALLSLEIRARSLDSDFWQEIGRTAQESATPPDRTWSTMPDYFRWLSGIPTPAHVLEGALRRRALDDDTHPSLVERLHALGLVDVGSTTSVEALSRLDEPIVASAAEHYLGSLARETLERFDDEWRTAASESWRRRHDELRRQRERADELLIAEAYRELTAAELFELACGLDDLGGDSTPYFKRTVDTSPQHAGALFMLGRNLLAAGDSTGVGHLRAAMSLDKMVVSAGSEMLRQYYAAHGDADGAHEMQWTQYEHSALMRDVAEERNVVTQKDTLVPAELSPNDIEHLRAVASSRPDVRMVWVARKKTVTLSDVPMFVVVVERRGWRWSLSVKKDQALASEFFSEIELESEGQLFLVAVTGRLAWLLKKIKKVPAAKVYDSEHHSAAAVVG